MATTTNNALAVVKEKVEMVIKKYPVVEEPLNQISSKLGGADRAYVAMGLITIVPLLIISVMGTGSFLTDLIGYLYPLYKSIEAIESMNADDVTDWLTYWLIFGFFKIAERFFDVFMGTSVFYFFAKVAFLVWCMAYQGSKMIYKTAIQPHLVPYVVGSDSESSKKTE